MNYRRFAPLSISLIALIAVIVLVAVNRPGAAPQVKGAATTSSKTQASHTNPQQPGVADPEQSQTATVASATSSTNSTKKQATTPAAGSNTTPQTQPNTPPASQPTSAPTPAPKPGFSIEIKEDEAYIWTVPGMPDTEQLIMPYDFTFDPGFQASGMESGGICEFLVTPTPDHNVLCNASEKDRGWLGVQYNSQSPTGHYKVKVSYTIGGTTATDVTEFDLQ